MTEIGYFYVVELNAEYEYEKPGFPACHRVEGSGVRLPPPLILL